MDDIDVKPEITENLLLASSSSKEGFGAGFDDALFVVKEEIIEDSALECDQEEQIDCIHPTSETSTYNLKCQDSEGQWENTEQQEGIEMDIDIRSEVSENFANNQLELGGNKIAENDSQKQNEEVDNKLIKQDIELQKTEFVDVKAFFSVECSQIPEPDSSRCQENLVPLPKSIKKRSKRHKCEYCGKLLSKQFLDSHVAKHTGLKPFVCEICGKGFGLKPNRDRHKFTHLEKRFSCDQCDKCFTLKQHLRIHKLKVHCELKPFNCEDCGESFIEYSKLAHHQISHMEVKSFHCDQCDQSFTLKEYLRTHTITQPDMKRVVCKDCGEEFDEHLLLNKHLMSHLNIKSFHCDQCNQSFTQEQYFLEHQQTHKTLSYESNKFKTSKILRKTLPKPSKSSVDNSPSMKVSKKRKSRSKKFGKSDPSSHKTNVNPVLNPKSKPFSCDLCGTGFTYKRNLLRHQRSHSNPKTVECSCCGRHLCDAKSLRRHMLSFHSGVEKVLL